jgi:bilirubin oxidase
LQDHSEFQTGHNAYIGQEAFYLLRDPHEQSLGLPAGDYDVTLMFASKEYNKDGSLNYDTHRNAGLWGDVISVYVSFQQDYYIPLTLSATRSRGLISK